MKTAAKERVNSAFLRQYAALEEQGSPGLVALLIDQFLTLSPERLQRVREALRERNPERLRRAAHALKNLAATVGAESLADSAAALEELGRAAELSYAGELLEPLELEGLAATQILIEIAYQLKK
jgi:HPt (histidine-containing phosphotransfer) domain-containing protein